MLDPYMGRMMAEMPDGPAMTPEQRRALFPTSRSNPTPRGYAAEPGTGPDGETCGSCRNHAIVTHGNRYHKCRIMQQIWSGGGGTDIRVSSPACAKWQEIANG